MGTGQDPTGSSPGSQNQRSRSKACPVGPDAGCLRRRRRQVGEQGAGLLEVPAEHRLLLVVAVGVRRHAVRAEPHRIQRHRGLRDPVHVVPRALGGIEPVPRQQLPSLGRDQVDRVEHEPEDDLGQEVGEVHPHPPGLDPLAPERDLLLELLRGREVDAEQPVAVRPGARAPPAGLDAEQIVQQRDDEVVVQVPAVVAHDERHDRQPRQVVAPEHLDVRVRLPPVAALAG